MPTLMQCVNAGEKVHAYRSIPQLLLVILCRGLRLQRLMKLFPNLQGYPALVAHFKNAAVDTGRSGGERAKYTGLVKQMESIEFLENVALMYDVLEELSSLSLLLQERSCTIPQADKRIRRTIHVIGAMKTKPGEMVKQCQEAATCGRFKDSVIMMSNSRIKRINRLQFLTSIVNNLERRCFRTTASHTKTTGIDHQIEDYSELLDELNILDSSTWPDKLDATFGSSSVKAMCRRFGFDEIKMDILDGYRDYVDCGGRRAPSKLRPLLDCVKTLPCSTAECERGFSAMNLIVTPSRTSLLLSHVSSLMFIRLNGPPLKQWNPQPYVKTWLLHHRSAIDTQARQVTRNSSDQELNRNELWTLFQSYRNG